ncbi:MAG: glycosyltransferase [Rubripirellula sp.]
MRAILSAPGSRGDVNPMIAIGRRLREAGHEVVISLAEPYADVAADAGLDVEVVIGHQQFTEALGNPHVWKPIRGPLQVFRTVVSEFLERHRDVIERYHVPGQTVLVSHPLDLASRIFRDAHPDTPLASVHLQPVILRTLDDPPKLSGWWFEMSRPQWLMRATYWLIDTVAVDPTIRTPINRMRSEYGMKPLRRPLNHWWHSPDLILAMYPDWFSPATKSFLPQLRHCGFPLQDNSTDDFVLPQDRPIVFTSGTAHHHCRTFFDAAVKACLQLKRPGLLLSTFPENFPAELPESVRAMPYMSFTRLLPHCAAIVHHGGVGTTSQALAAGIPQLIRPMAFDQFDNANRIEKLGCGRWLRNDRELANELQQILDKPVNNPGKHQVAEHPGQVAGQEQSQADAAGHAVGFLEEMLSERGDAGVAT